MRSRALLLLSPMVLALTAMTGCFTDIPDPAEERLLALNAELMDSSRFLRIPANSLTLGEAVSFALENNLSIRAAELEYAIENEIKTGAALKMLPSLHANLGLSERNKVNASSSQSVITGRESLESSFSSERSSRPHDLTLVWSLLDFGLGALRTQQAADRERIAGQKLRRLRQQIAMDVAIAYYRLCAAEEIIRRCSSLEPALRLQIRIYRDESEDRNISESERARRSAPLLTGLRSLRDYRRERELARANLAKAMGVTQPMDLSLAPTAWPLRPPTADGDIESLHRDALLGRPEMYNADSDVRILMRDAKASLLQMAPNVNLSASLHHDGDRFLVYHNWMEAALQVSWDLLRLPQKRNEVKTARQRVELADMRRRVTAASVMMQVNLALVELAESRDRLELAEEIEENRRAILRGVEDGAEKGKRHEADILTERLLHINEVANLCWAASDCMAAHARLQSALGRDFEPEAQTPAPVPAKAKADAQIASGIVRIFVENIAAAQARRR